LSARRSFRGVAALVALLLGLAAGACSSSKPQRPHRPDLPTRIGGKRTLIVSMDAVPFTAIERLAQSQSTRRFRDLGPPVPLLSSFPSSTTLAFTGIFEPFGLERPPGYEARFYDLDLGRVRGGGLLSYQRIRFSWREFFDWKTHGLFGKWVSYVMPGRFARKEVRRAVEAFLESDHDPYFVYIGATDGVAHLHGPGGFENVFLELEHELRVARSREDFYTVVLSDHGVGPGMDRPPALRNVRRAVRRTLRAAGYRMSSRAGDDRVALVPFGLLSSFAVFGGSGQGEDLAEVLSATDGVSVCAAPDGDGWVVRDGEELARIERRGAADSSQWRYQVVAGDPLEYQDLAGTWRDSSEWLERTAERRFPDALHRIARAFDLVENPASALCSTSTGHMFGPWTTDLVGRLTVGALRWTHGALERPDTWGFFMTDHPHLLRESAVRFDEALVGLVAGAARAPSPRPASGSTSGADEALRGLPPLAPLSGTERAREQLR
jgi:hypothetical protein